MTGIIAWKQTIFDSSGRFQIWNIALKIFDSDRFLQIESN